jgi:cell division ATPase FtsA
MFSLVIAHLKKIEKHELLPAGIVLTGGGSGLETMEDFARGAMHLPSTTPANTLDIPNLPKSRRHGKDTSWFVAYGLTVWGAFNDRPSEREHPSSFASVKEFFSGLMKQFIP